MVADSPSNEAPPTRSFGRVDLAVAVVMILLWGFNIVAMKTAVDNAGALPAALLRQAMVAVVCLPFIRIVPGRMGRVLLLSLLSGGLFYVAIAASLAVTRNVSAIAIAGQLGVPFSLILAVLFLKEKIGWPRLFGILLALSGVVLLVLDPEAGRELPGLSLSALASLIWATSTLIQRGTGGIGVFTLTGWMGLVGALFILPICLALDPQGLVGLVDQPAETFVWAGYAAIGSSIGGHGAMIWLLQRHDVSVVSPLTIPTPVVGVLFATWWFGTPLTPLMIAGGLIAMIGVSIVAIRNAQKSRSLAEARLREEGVGP